MINHCTMRSLSSFFFLLALIFPVMLFAANKQANVLSYDGNEYVIELNFPAFSFSANAASGAMDPVLQNASVLMVKGAPALPFYAVPLAIDADGEWQAEMIDSSFSEMSPLLISPSRGNLKRNQDISQIPYTKGAVYSEDAFYPSRLLSSSQPYILRSVRGISIQVMAAQYHPIDRVLRTYQRVVFKLKRVGASGLNPLPSAASQLKSSVEWSRILNRHFLSVPAHLKYNQTIDDGNMLIVCHNDPAFLSEMQAFVRWKTERGMKVQMITYNQAGGSAAALKAYIQNHFISEAWSFVLLVGDAQQIPPSYITAGPSDQWFADVVGNDHYPDLLIGRFSANNPAELATQVKRSIWYEKDIQASAQYLANAIGIASNEGPGDDNQMDWEHQRAIMNQLTSYTYTNGFELYDGTHAGADAPGDPAPADLAALVNDGAGIINYTGHGGSTSFVTTGFSNADALSLNNVGKLPFIYAVACVNGEFQAGTCFAEAWLRSEDNGEPTGAVAAFMSTINQSWNPPMEGQDEMNAILSESIAGNIKRTYAGIAVNGCLKMNDSYGSAGTEMTDTWTVFGDPSLLIRTDVPSFMQVNHASSVPLGTQQLTVSVSEDSAMVAICQNGVLLDAALVSGGQASLSFSPISLTDSLLVTVTGYNKITYRGMIEVIAPNTSYVVMTAQSIQDPSGNNNQLADYDEQVEALLQISNLGLLDANNISVQISTQDTLILSWSPQSFNPGALVAGAQLNLPAVQIQTADLIPDGHEVLFQVSISDGTQTVNQDFSITLHAPVLGSSGFVVNDNAGGNGNGRIDAGETVTVTTDILNVGSSLSPAGTVQLNSWTPSVTILSQPQSIVPIGSSPVPVSFQVQASAQDTLAYQANFDLQVTAGVYGHQSPRSAMVNLIVEDFETNTLQAWDWNQQGNANWFTTTTAPFEGNYCSQSGTILDNQSSSMLITLDVASADSISFARKVSSEQDWDFLRFYMDNNLMGEWTGNLPWQKVSYPVPAGIHVFRWTYIKDSYLSDGSDCAWIDEIVWPPLVQEQDTASTGTSLPEYERLSMHVYPNPATDWAITEFYLKEAAEVRAVLTDAAGRHIRQVLPSTSLGRGSQKLSIPLNGLSSGLYILSLDLPGGRVHQPLNVKK